MKIRSVFSVVMAVFTVLGSASAETAHGSASPTEIPALLALRIGAGDEIGFFSNYAGVSAGIEARFGRVRVGISQKINYGFTYREISGLTEARVYVAGGLYVNAGVSYLVQPSPLRGEPDFDAAVLPLLGAGYSLPLLHESISLVPFVQMNQSFYLPQDTALVYADLPFLIAFTAGVAVEIDI